MFLSDISIKRPVMMTMVILTCVVIGLFSLTKLGIDLFPEIDFPFVTVMTIYPGAGPQEVETLITKPIEEEVAAISGLKEMISVAQEGVSVTFLEFEMTRDADLAAIDVKDKVDAIRGDLPQDAEDPVISKFDINSIPVMNLAVSSPRPLDKLYILVDDEIKTALNRIDGLASVDILGGKEREIVVAVDRRKLEGYGLSILQIVQALAQENLNLPSGHIAAGRKEYSIRVKGEFADIETIEQLYLPVDRDDPPVRLSDIATVEDTFKEQREMARMNGVTSVGLSLVKRSDANSVLVGNDIKKELARLKQSLPEDITIEIARDRSESIQDSVDDVRNNLIIGILLTALVLFLFLHNWKGTVIAAISMPVSIISTFTLLNFAGFTLNMMSLMALAISVGVLVTNSIVVLENIERYNKKGKSLADASSIGTKEIAIAVAAAALTNVVVFTPIAFMAGIVGQFFKQFGLTVAFATLFSLLISFTLTPMMAAYKLRRSIYVMAALITSLLVYYALGLMVLLIFLGVLLLIAILTWTGLLKKFFTAWDRVYDGMAISYRKGLVYCLEHRILVLGVTSLLFISSLFVGGTFVGSEFFPASDYGEFSISVEMPAGATFDQTDKVLHRLEDEINKIPEVETVFSQIGTSESGEFTISEGVHLGVIVVQLKDKPMRQRSTNEILNELRPQLADIPAAQLVLKPGDMFGGGSEADLTIEVLGPDVELLADLADQVVAIAGETRGVLDPRSSYKVGKPEMKVTPRRGLLADQNTSVSTLGVALRTMIEGQRVSKYREGDREYDIRVKFREADLNLDQVPEFSIMGGSGPQMISSVGHIEYTEGPSQIMRKNKQRIVQVTAELSGVTVGKVQTVLEEKFAQMSIPEGYIVRVAGQSDDMAESFAEMGRALILAIILTYMLMAAILESYIHPLTIMMTLPLGLIGVLYALFLTGNSISMMSLMAIIMLVGIVVNNGILLIDYTQHLRRNNGVELYEAVLDAAPTRLRPIIMINLATALGMLPLALGMGTGGEFRAPMAVSAIGGLATSTVFTLFLIPIIYYTFESWKLKK
ncbi:efflux RND transporter permease subunit [bacterium]|nr:efflux RND transporter permease subunit [bacterium]